MSRCEQEYFEKMKGIADAKECNIMANTKFISFFVICFVILPILLVELKIDRMPVN